MAETHCETPAEQTIENEDCCIEQVAYIKFSFDGVSDNAQQDFMSCPETILYTSHLLQVYLTANSITGFVSRPPPPLPGRDILLRSELLRI